MQAQQGSSYRSAASGAAEQEPSAATAGRQHHQATADDDEDDEPVERDPSGRSASGHIMASERAAFIQACKHMAAACLVHKAAMGHLTCAAGPNKCDKGLCTQQREVSSSVQKLCSAATLQP